MFPAPHAAHAEGARIAAVYCGWRIGASSTSAERTAVHPDIGLVIVRMISFPARESGQRARMAVRWA